MPTSNRWTAFTRSAVLAIMLASCGASVSQVRSGLPGATQSVAPDPDKVVTTTRFEKRPETPVSYAPVSPVRLVPQQIAVVTAIDNAMARMSGSGLVSARQGPPPTPVGWQGTWLYITVRSDGSDPPSQMRAVWEGQVVQGAIAEQLATGTNLADAVAGSMISIVTPSGAAPDVMGGAGDVVANQRFDGPTSLDILRPQVGGALAKYGLNLTDIRVYDAFGPAVAIVATIDTATRSAVDLVGLQAELTGNGSKLSAVYLEVHTPTGKVIARLANTYRVGAGSQWIDAAYRDVVSGVPYSTVAGAP